ncbi:MAG: AraC family transcriptional regulator [Clostridia bacterium]|nr:AraC family transcriptional regulator [Clostridia bacterium]
MSKLTDRISYLKGMAAGMKLNMDKDSNKLMLEMLTVMGEMAEEMAAMTEAHNDLNEYVESIDDDLAELEETLFGEEDGEIDEEMAAEDDDEDEFGDDDLIVYACPHCGHEIEFHASDVDFDEDYLCPECQKPIFPELNEDE